LPRFAGDRLPVGNVACSVALADKLESLIGFFGIGDVPTGDRDPFGLRRTPSVCGGRRWECCGF